MCGAASQGLAPTLAIQDLGIRDRRMDSGFLGRPRRSKNRAAVEAKTQGRTAEPSPPQRDRTVRQRKARRRRRAPGAGTSRT